uniref:Uncharacterized protein n=1 Tax=Glossina pallidipes TaxID=7398 RepID=A0A1A9ZIH6_GLOPL
MIYELRLMMKYRVSPLARLCSNGDKRANLVFHYQHYSLIIIYYGTVVVCWPDTVLYLINNIIIAICHFGYKTCHTEMADSVPDGLWRSANPSHILNSMQRYYNKITCWGDVF